VQFKKQSKEKKIEFDTMRKEGNKIVTQKGKSFDIENRLLSDMKWGTIMSTDTKILSLLTSIIKKGKKLDQAFYTVGQGINVSQNAFIPKEEKQKFQQKKNIINAVFKEYRYTYSRFSYFLYHSFVQNDDDTALLQTINAAEFENGQRKYPAVIMPRGIGAIHFAGLLNGNALSNSFVDIYMNTQDEEKKLNIWLFCNSSLFFLYRELSGRKNLGGGLLKSEAADIKQFPLYFPFANKKTILSIASEMGEPINLPDRLETSIQKKIDKLVFSYFVLAPKIQTRIISELLRQFYFRYNKAK
jgi:DNA-binding ferritin-like protein (Dps family)